MGGDWSTVVAVGREYNDHTRISRRWNEIQNGRRPVGVAAQGWLVRRWRTILAVVPIASVSLT